MSTLDDPMSTLDDFDILDPETVDDPYPFYAALRECAPVYQVPETDIYLVSKRHLIEEALERHDDFSANLTGVLMSGPAGEHRVFDLSRLGGTVDAIANADEPSHSVHRKIVLPEVTPKNVASLEPILREWAIELIDPIVRDGRGDWMDAVANPLPTRATALVVGLPLDDGAELLEWATTGTEILAGVTTSDRFAAIAAKTGEMASYLSEHLQRAITALEAGSVPGMLGRIAEGVRDGLISQGDGVSILVVLVGAGAESTSGLTGNAVRILAEQPALQQELRENLNWIPDFVEEAVRLEPSFRGHYRHVKRDTKLGDVALPEGSRILLLWAAANRDPETFDDPDAINLRRHNIREHLSFGRGIHFCVGARLARLEARVILEELLTRTSMFTLDSQRPPRYVPSIFVRRHAELALVIEA